MIHQATYESRNFTFEAYGRTAEEAKAVLRRTLVKHAKQYGIPDEWFLESDGNFVFNTNQIEVGCGYRDQCRVV